ncbi:MAG: hypothetical protein AB7F32_11720 [Victivallaceae bacterium]
MSRILWMVAAAVFLAGCVTEVLTPQTKFGEVNAKKKDFPVLEDCQLEFVSVGPLNFKTGEAVKLSFALRNKGLKPVRIPEWRMNETDNIRIYCQNWLPNSGDKPDPNLWVRIDDEVKQPELRYTLELMPDNQAIVTRKLDFADSLVISTGAERRYFIRAELNLKSVRVDPVECAIAISNMSGHK